MNRFFNMENPVFMFLGRLADIMLLNIIFLITCIPIVTIGSAWTALSYMTMKMVRNEESYIVRGYFKSFKQNFKQSTLMWLIVLVFSFLLFLDFRILNTLNATTGTNVLRVGVWTVCIIAMMVLSYLFPLVAKFYNTIKNTFINAFLMSIRHLPQTVIMIAIPIIAIVVTFLNNWTFTYGILVWLMFGFTLISMAKSWFLVKIFDNYIPDEEKDHADEEVSTDSEE